MKILLALFTGNEFEHYPFNEYPLGLLSLAEYVNARLPGVEFRIVVGPLTCAQVADFGPDLIGLSVLTPYFTAALATADQIKSRFPAIPIIMGGHHITYLPHNLPASVVVGVIGEGEVTFLELCRLLLDGQPLTAATLGAIAGLVYRKADGALVQTPRRPFMPVGDIPIVQNFHLCKFTSDKPLRFNIMSSRGCLYRCRFCSSSPFWGGVRYYTAQNTVAQIAYIVKTHRPAMIHIADDLMVADHARLKLIRDQIVELGIQKSVSFECWVTGNQFDRTTAQLLKDMHVTLVCIAVESGSPAVYKYLKGSWNTPAQTARAMRLARQMGMAVSTCVILGSPPETVADMQLTYDFLKAAPFDCGLAFILKALPGSRLWDEVRQRGLVADTMADWSVLKSDDVLNPTTVFLSESATREQVNDYYVKIGELIKQKTAQGQPRCDWRHKLRRIFHIP